MDGSELFRDGIKQTYGFSEWVKKVRGGEGSLSQNFLPVFGELLAVTFEKRRALPDQRNAYIDHYKSTTDDDLRFAVTVVEFPTIHHAHEGLIDLLTNCMAPSLPRIEEKGIKAGDIGYAGHADIQTLVFFARANVLIKVESVGKKEESVKSLAELIDKQILQHIAAKK